MRIFEVGGCVRDEILGVPTKDIDFAVEMNVAHTHERLVTSAFLNMKTTLLSEGFTIFTEAPEFFTVRAKFPKGSPNEKLVADFVMCRKDGPSSDNRRPDFVLVGTLEDDLARRDFTMNAIARNGDGTLIDPHNGQQDIADRIIRFVGDPMERLREDGLRALRGLRFSITKNMTLHRDTLDAIASVETPSLLAGVSKERMRDELDKMFRVDTLATLNLFHHFMTPAFMEAIFDGALRLKPTMEA